MIRAVASLGPAEVQQILDEQGGKCRVLAVLLHPENVYSVYSGWFEKPHTLPYNFVMFEAISCFFNTSL